MATRRTPHRSPLGRDAWYEFTRAFFVFLQRGLYSVLTTIYHMAISNFQHRPHLGKCQGIHQLEDHLLLVSQLWGCPVAWSCGRSQAGASRRCLLRRRPGSAQTHPGDTGRERGPWAGRTHDASGGAGDAPRPLPIFMKYTPKYLGVKGPDVCNSPMFRKHMGGCV